MSLATSAGLASAEIEVLICRAVVRKYGAVGLVGDVDDDELGRKDGSETVWHCSAARVATSGFSIVSTSDVWAVLELTRDDSTSPQAARAGPTASTHSSTAVSQKCCLTRHVSELIRFLAM